MRDPEIEEYVLYIQQPNISVKKKEGFTLLEVLLSIAIIGSLLVTLLYSLNYHLGIADRHTVITVATGLAKGKMYEAEKKLSSGRGYFEEPFRDFSFETRIMDSSYPGMKAIEVVVSNGYETIRLNKLIENKNE
jgi:general secretion pathway protein I